MYTCTDYMDLLQYDSMIDCSSFNYLYEVLRPPSLEGEQIINKTYVMLDFSFHPHFVTIE